MDLGDDLADYNQLGIDTNDEPIDFDPSENEPVGLDPGGEFIAHANRHFDLNDDDGETAAPRPKKRRDPNVPHPLDYYLNYDASTSLQDKLKSKKARLELENYERLTMRLDWIRRERESGPDGGLSLEGGSSVSSSRCVGAVSDCPPSNAGNWIRISSPNARRRYYAPVKHESLLIDSENRYCEKAKLCLLATEYENVLSEAIQIQMEERMLGEDDFLNSLENEMSKAVESSNNRVSTVKKDSELWVEKYQPKSFTDLLSDDGINRTVITWLKLWDECVFGRKVPLSNRNELMVGKKEAEFVKKRPPPWLANDADFLSTELDNFKRPQHKVILLSGPPGLGKTTLAHIIGKQAGYYVQEINASDERSLDSFKTAIEKATQFSATLDRDSRPSCLVIDEIDGAPAICRRESVSAELRALESICVKTQMDIRSCLNSLQFAKRPTSYESADSTKWIVSIKDVNQTPLGVKDHQSSLFDTWKAIFKLHRMQQGEETNNKKGSLTRAENDMKRRSQALWHMVERSVDVDKLHAGLWDNFLLPLMKGTNLINQTAKMGDLFLLNDKLTGLIGQRQEWILARYKPVLFVSAHLTFALPNPHRIVYPHSLAEVNAELYSSREREDLKQVVEVMLGMGLTYRQTRTAEGQYVYELEPSIEEVIQFSQTEKSEIMKPISYSTKQMIAREIGLERVRKSMNATSNRGGVGSNVSKRSGNEEAENLKTSGPRVAATTNHLQRVTPISKSISLKNQNSAGPRNYFTSSKSSGSNVDGKKDAKQRQEGIWYKFIPGYSNAVRTNVKMSQFL